MMKLLAHKKEDSIKTKQLPSGKGSTHTRDSLDQHDHHHHQPEEQVERVHAEEPLSCKVEMTATVDNEDVVVGSIDTTNAISVREQW